MGVHTDCPCRWLAQTKERSISTVRWRVTSWTAFATVRQYYGSFTLQYKSATAIGKAEILTDREEKIFGLRAICQRFLPHHMDAFDDAIARSLERTAVVRITLTEPPVGKRKQYDKEGEEMKWGRTEFSK